MGFGFRAQGVGISAKQAGAAKVLESRIATWGHLLLRREAAAKRHLSPWPQWLGAAVWFEMV